MKRNNLSSKDVPVKFTIGTSGYYTCCDNNVRYGVIVHVIHGINFLYFSIRCANGEVSMCKY